MTVEVFLDLICPRCYLALHHLQDALAVFEHGSEVQIVYRGFQLDPVRGRSFHEILVEDVMRNHRMTRPESDDVAADVQERLREAAGRDGLLYRPEAAGPVDTFARCAPHGAPRGSARLGRCGGEGDPAALLR
jgi:predicted DsbA family dithiol-disulfide isomerase